MPDLVKPLLLIAAALAVPIVPFLILGDGLESRVEGWLGETLRPGQIAALVVALLAVDIFLPIPSSVVSTLAGNALGFWPATGASWLGMMLGSAAAFALARAFGRPLAARLSGEAELARMDRLADRFGPLVLVLARPVPVLAEASVLLFGTTRLAWRRFLLPVGATNLGIAASYAALGQRVELPVALAASIAIPVLAALLARRWWPGERPA